MKTKRQKLEALMSDMPQYKVVDVTKIQDEYEARYSETIAKSYVIRLYGTASERVHNNALPHSTRIRRQGREWR